MNITTTILLISMLVQLAAAILALRLIRPSGRRTVKADQDQIEQVIVNLVVNARDAMPGGGRLVIVTRSGVFEDSPLNRQTPYTTRTWVVLSVSDSGCGIGTTFNVFLPRTRESLESPRLETPLEEELRGSEVILLAEDDGMVRRLVGSVLEGAGYRVIQASNGREAVEIFNRSQERIDLLISDVVMPQMGGGQLAHLLSRQRREMRIMLVTGHATRQPLIEELIRDGVALLRKPFDRDALLRKVREVLDVEPSSSQSPVLSHDTS